MGFTMTILWVLWEIVGFIMGNNIVGKSMELNGI